jgi:hypothetical protein
LLCVILCNQRHCKEQILSPRNLSKYLNIRRNRREEGKASSSQLKKKKEKKKELQKLPL